MTSATALCPPIPHLLPPNFPKTNRPQTPPSLLATVAVSVTLRRNREVTVRRNPAVIFCASLGGLGESVSAAAAEEEDKKKRASLVVVNFYKFVRIEDPRCEVARHLTFLEDLDIHGRIYLTEQGINAQISPAPDGHAFPRLKVQLRPLVQVEGGISHLPLVDPSRRATPLSPSDWKKQIEAVNNDHSASSADSSVVVLDLRNGYEWDIGHFRGAMRPDVDCFRSTSFGLSQSRICSSDPLVDVDKEKTNILIYCTGGIRCDVYSTILRERGFKNLYTLKGGVSHYLEKEGPAEWIGNLFVFDSRLSLPPPAFRPNCSTKDACLQQLHVDEKFARCYTCGSIVDELRHRNCANLDCNLLFLCCPECLHSLKGCCSQACTSASRLRPVLPGRQRYQKWHLYRDTKVQA
ncbi:hypothetical protein MLD38_025103 [Melastoma candidum]|uniref:Uncharacterized protein n=1 Tax=Melastoma candidum TaxID=119954 RepID=A0ACB9NU91_9MYRT|nr:hypothetical protein MLD38_025103 [Melastoma candidum]